MLSIVVSGGLELNGLELVPVSAPLRLSNCLQAEVLARCGDAGDLQKGGLSSLG